MPPVNNVIHVRCKILETPIVLERIFELEKNNLNQNKINSSSNNYFNTINTTGVKNNIDKYNYNEPDLKNIDNLNINSIINEKNGNAFTTPNKNKQKILFHSYSDINLTKSINYNNFNNSINNSNNSSFKKDNFQNINEIKNNNNNFIYTPIKKDTQFKIYESATKTTNSYNLPNSSKYSSFTFNNNQNSKVSSLLYSNSEKNILKNNNTISKYNANNNQNVYNFYTKVDLNKKNENNALMTPIKKSSQHIISYSNNIESSINYTEPNSSKYSAFPKINFKQNIISSSNIKGALKTTNNYTIPINNIYYSNSNNNKVTLSTNTLNNNTINKKDNIPYQNNYNYNESTNKKLDNLNINNILNTKKENNYYYQPNLTEYKNSNIKNNKNSFGLTYSNSEKNIIKNKNFDNIYKNTNGNNYIKTNNFEYNNLNINKTINDNSSLLYKPINNNNQHIKYNSFSNYITNAYTQKPSYNPAPIKNYNYNNYYTYSK